MRPQHGFQHSNETDQNEPKHHYCVQKHDWVDSFHFWPESEHRFIFDPNRCIECNPGMVSVTVMKPTKRNQNITIGSKKHDCCVRFKSGPNRCIVLFSARIGALNATPAWFPAQ